ncbi:MAG: hypothetical protein A2017_12535 [Lentisphaerae bacterium GWF2_44_16]|nr:MAG: hypothetical protein A2017_12535 [Lentisphaerae bacterium GWF2_44_16]
MSYLFRGVNEELYNLLNGKIQPKSEKSGLEFPSYVCAGDPHAVCGSGVVAGKSINNTVILHQWNQEGYPTSGVSTSPIKERARFYALEGGKRSKGYIYTLSIDLLKKCNVAIYRVKDFATYPAVPEDDEHILVANNFQEIPIAAIVTIEFIENDILSCSHFPSGNAD